ncbi:2-amino-4-hydroxy-6-hydroxymethyldihydropteridine diphosphokinase [Auraticoccus sp. F435]|uniref:2-amino-4-hydroxy-6-hydroxymethyldihydropteridine diphosphokinase n=1 Tax=Auraticoccus cholistanensis TaxID=2656650 RepID=A0A6A9UYI7_9ACTN|nr:2-amino-4-hydroxy-6-hydroxymethyldihydropteridine diphosphokinase [Auraticoccus cholistanensis]MVA76985.1 2-amino-4-hydroxy-6-hydroxymethyldihydropteridine diphosphokinase [Auraticoccus cholistanensis]
MTSPNPYAIDADTLSGMKPIRQVVFALGSNDGDPLSNLQGAVAALRDTPDVIVVDVSSVYETDAVGGPADNPPFLNAVVLAETTLDETTLLERALAIEDAYGRVRREHWGPRTLDVDLVVVGRAQVERPDLRLPHPRAHERAFVLVPWAEVEPAGEIPGHGMIADLLESLDTSGVRRRDDLSLED